MKKFDLKHLLSMFSFIFLTMVSLGQPPVQKPIGTNLTAVLDYSTEFVFTDAMKQSRTWMSTNWDDSGPWSTNIPVPLNSDGFPVEIPYDDGVNPLQKLRTLMLWDIGVALPIGMYRLVVEGDGEVKLGAGASGTFTCPVDTLVQVNDGVILEITESNVANPISDIKFIYPDYVNNYQTKTFNDDFLSFIADFQVLRFMDWLNTNNSTSADWNSRSKLDYFTQAQEHGVAWEYIVELTNLTSKDIWINIPHLADDNYISSLAAYLESNLNSQSKIYLEYSNEVWNSQFSQHSESANLGQSLHGYTGQEWERAWKYTARRSADIFHVFDSVFNDTSRFIRTIPTQAGNSWVGNEIMTYFNDVSYNPNLVSADALAIAPYFGGIADQIVLDGVVSTITIPEILLRMENSLAQTSQWILENKLVSDSYGIDLIAYEGGQHLVGTGLNVDNNALTTKLIAANRAAELQGIYCDYFDDWYTNVGGLFMHFSSHATPTKWGSWGVKENHQDMNNPKYLALQNCVFNANGNVGINEESKNEEISIGIYPNPSNDLVNFKNKKNQEEFRVIDALGKTILTSKENQFSVKTFSKGLYFVHFNDMILKLIVD